MATFADEILTPAQNKSWDTVHENEHDDWAFPEKYGGIDDPTADQLDAFLTCVQDKATNADQQDAVDFIGTTQIQDLPGSPGRTIAYQTALRVVDPDSIWQGPYGFCGPAAIVYDFAKHFPLQYAQCIISLQNNGVASMQHNAKAFNLRADASWNTTYRSAGLAKTKMGPADFLILHAIRRAAEYNVHSFDVTKPGQDSDATPPDKMVQFLEDSGYLHVTNKTFGYDQFQYRNQLYDLRGQVTIGELARQIRMPEGPLVIMLVHHSLAEAASGADVWKFFKNAEKLSDLHWICVDSFDQSPDNYRMSFMSWGTRCTGTYTELQFRSCFYGYISAVP